MKITKKSISKLIYLLIGIMLIFLGWHLGYLYSPNNIIPPIGEVIKSSCLLLIEKNAMLALGYTTYRVVICLLIVVILAYVLGVLSAFYPQLGEILSPVVYLISSLPSASIIFILIIFTDITNYLLVSFLIFPIIYKGVYLGSKTIIQTYESTIRLEGRYKLKNLFKVVCPLSLPYLTIGLAQGIPLALKAEIMGEVFMSSTRYIGLGRLINQAYLDVDMVRLFSLTLLAIVLILIIDFLMRLAKKSIDRRFGITTYKTYHF